MWSTVKTCSRPFQQSLLTNTKIIERRIFTKVTNFNFLALHQLCNMIFFFLAFIFTAANFDIRPDIRCDILLQKSLSENANVKEGQF